MKKIIAALGILLVSSSVMAQHRHYHTPPKPHYQHSHRNNYNWVAPAVIGGLIGYGIYQQQVTPPPVVMHEMHPSYVYQPRQCGPWVTQRNYDGTVTRSRTCTQ